MMAARVQLALNVSDVDAAVDFYSKLFGVGPVKQRPGYANFAVDVPPLKLVLIENPQARGAGVTGALNHLGVEVESTDDVVAATRRLAEQGLATATQEGTSCCYAVQDKVWVDDPDGAPWEVYTVLADVEASVSTQPPSTQPPSTQPPSTQPPSTQPTIVDAAVPGSACACGPAGCGPEPTATAAGAQAGAGELLTVISPAP